MDRRRRHCPGSRRRGGIGADVRRGGTDDPAAQLTAFSSGTPATLTESIADSLRSSGVDPEQGAAVTVPSPTGGASWIVAQDESDACLVVPSAEGTSSGTCGTAALLRRGGIVGYSLDDAAAASEGIPASIAEARAHGAAGAMPGSIAAARTASSPRAGTADFSGLAADDVVSVEAVTGDGTALASAKVANSVWALPDVSWGEVTAIQFTHEDGATTAISLIPER